MGVRHGLGALLCGLLLPLAGCGDGESSADPPASPAPTSSSPTPTPTPSGPVIPEAAKGADEASAKAFVRFWFETLSDAMVTGDTDQVAAVSLPRCVSCKSIAGRIDNIYDKGGYLETNGWRPELLAARPVDLPKRRFYLRIRQASSTLFDTEGSRVSRRGEEIDAAQVMLVPRGGSWRVESLVFIR